jgi:large subunit ribosomal protein L35
MPKLKTHKATAKRFRYTGGGKLLRTKIGKSHLRRKKARRVKALFDQMLLVEHTASQKRIKRLAPYLDKQ